MTARTPLILDVDTGIDDSLALLYAAASPDAELVAVTCVFGQHRRPAGRDQQPRRPRAGRPDRCRGRARPRGPAGPGARDDAGDARPPGPGPCRAAAAQPALSERHAVDLIVEEARRRPGEIMLVTLGPLTNLALALEREPALPRLLRGYTLMGGAFGVSGNTTPTTEWNIHCDPEAARIVFRAWADAMAADPSIPRPLALGLDVTEQAKIVPDDVVRLARRAGSTPDDSIALARGEDPMLATRSVASNPDRPVRRRRAALLHGVPRAVRRVLRRLHPRSAGRGRGARPGPGDHRGALRRRRDGRRAHQRHDGRRSTATHREGAQPRCRAERRTSRPSWTA